MKIGTAVPSKYYEEVAKQGYDYIEFAGTEISAMSDEDFNQLVKKVQEIGLPVKGYNAYCNGDVPIVGEGYSRQKAMDYAEKMCQRGKALGIETIGIGAPMARKIPENYSLDLADEQATDFVQITADVAKKYGITVLFEAVHNHMCDYANYTKDCKKIVDMANRDNVQMILDFYHVEVMGEDIIEALSTKGVVHLHINKLLDNYGRGYITKNDGDYLKSIKDALTETNYAYNSITIEAEAQYYEPYGEEGLEMMRKYF